MTVDEKKPETAVAKKLPLGIEYGSRGLCLSTFEDAYRFAKVVCECGLAPKSFDTPEKVLVAIQMGAELGFSPMRALAAISVVNGKPGLMGEGALAKIREVGVCSAPPVTEVKGDGDGRMGIVTFQRKDMPQPVTVTFSA